MISEKISFLLCRCLVLIRGMGTLFIVESHILIDSRSEFNFRDFNDFLQTFDFIVQQAEVLNDRLLAIGFSGFC